MTDRIDFYFDFGSPNAYLAHKVVPEMEQRLGVRFGYRPALLGGVFKAIGNRSPAEAFAEIKPKLAYERLEMQRFIDRHRIVGYRHNPHFPVNTLQLMRGVMAARELDLFAPYVSAVFAGMWEQGLKLDDPAVLATALTQAGLPAAEIAALSAEPRVKAALMAATEELVDRGGFGSPTFFVGDEIFFGKDRLREVEDEVLATRARASVASLRPRASVQPQWEL
jgi:2-hydroxychromene-2-carboxylate isomerase